MKNRFKVHLFLWLFPLLFPSFLFAQIYSTGSGHIWFFSEAPLENIEAHNHQAACALNMNSGEMVCKVTIDRFEFEKDLMKKHFNENYLESETYPHSSFKGSIENFYPEIIQTDSIIHIIIAGELLLHGVTKSIREQARLKIRDSAIEGEAVFTLKLEDYKIKIPRAVIKNIAEEVDVHVEITLTPYKK